MKKNDFYKTDRLEKKNLGGESDSSSDEQQFKTRKQIVFSDDNLSKNDKPRRSKQIIFNNENPQKECCRSLSARNFCYGPEYYEKTLMVNDDMLKSLKMIAQYESENLEKESSIVKKVSNSRKKQKAKYKEKNTEPSTPEPSVSEEKEKEIYKKKTGNKKNKLEDGTVRIKRKAKEALSESNDVSSRKRSRKNHDTVNEQETAYTRRMLLHKKEIHKAARKTECLRGICLSEKRRRGTSKGYDRLQVLLPIDEKKIVVEPQVYTPKKLINIAEETVDSHPIVISSFNDFSESFFPLNKVNKMYICPHEDCDKEFPSLSRIKRHYIIHTPIKPFKCLNTKCKKTFSRKDNMVQHYRIHCPYSTKVTYKNDGKK